MNKRLLFTLAIFCFSISIKAQTVNGIPIADIQADYVQITGTERGLTSKLRINIDFGQKTRLLNKDKQTVIRDKNGKILDFNSFIDALNFMSENGYEFVDVYSVGTDSFYILKRKNA